ncbi:hypothetical protein T552_03032 [Pneumocystis carinii B80]|uniref:HOOK N-terminal domain-containing protein n=1 Tax=Pneumocystis carinii (strain B80) TaxID=1408658 RepID=A0A0W4ZCJ1_PNEC8|nr:hypothetical protein T552_03032 [Pneumocystis carinii B80]KTW26139.1 hypothetical protein T552_03032 [Pneumocystis carinii B80]
MNPEEERVKMALFHWINTFDIDRTDHEIRCFEELSDGIIIYKILLEIDPSFFHNTIEAIPVDNGIANRAYRLNNGNMDVIMKRKYFLKKEVKRIYKYLEKYYEEKRGQSFAEVDKDIPNVEAIAKNSSEREMVKLLKIVLRCSFFQENWEKSVKRMKNLDSEIQEVLEQINHEGVKFEGKNDLNEKTKKKMSNFDEEIAIISKEKDILRKNYELILEENVILREDQKIMKSKLNSMIEKLDKAENLNTDYESQINHLQTQVNEFECELHQYKDNSIQKDMEIQRQNEIIIFLTHEKEEFKKKMDEYVLLREELQKEKQNLEKERNLINIYKQKLEKDLNILNQEEILNFKNISYRKNNKMHVSIHNENVVKDDILESEFQETPCNKLANKTSELNVKCFKNDSETKENKIQPFYEKINILQQSKEDFHNSLSKSSKDLDNELKHQSNAYPNSQISQFQQESDMPNKKTSERSIVVIKNLINNFKKSKDKTEDKHFEKNEKKNELDHQIHNNNNNNNNNSEFLKDSKLNSSFISSKIDAIPETQIQELENLNILNNNRVMKFQMDKENICDLILADESSESKELQVELNKLKKSIKDLEDENKYQINIINELHKEKDTLMHELIINKDLLSNLQQENNKLNSTITSISETIDQERKKQLEAQEKIEELQNELDQSVTGALKAKQLLKKQDAIIKECKEKMALCKSTDELYDELAFKDKQIEELKKINNEETAKLKEENARMINAWYNLASHMQQKNPTVQHTFIQSPSSFD